MVMPQNESEEASSTEVAQDINSGEPQHNLEGRDSINVLSRLSKVENENINVLKQLNGIAAANITSQSKVEEDNKKLFNEMQDMRAAIDSINDLNVRVLGFYDSRNIETQVYDNRRKRNSEWKIVKLYFWILKF